MKFHFLQSSLRLITLLVLVSLCPTPSLAQELNQPVNQKAHQDSSFLELSFGTSQMFISTSDHEELKNKSKIVLPTNSALLLAEWIWSAHWSGMLAYNLPLSTQKFMVQNTLVEENANPTLLIGPRFSPFVWRIKNRIDLDPQIGLLACSVIAKNFKTTASLASRLHIAEKNGFTMYMGGVYTLGIDGWTLFYGAGHRF